MSEQPTIKDRFEKILKETHHINSNETLLKETTLVDDLGMDSLELIQFVVNLEGEFDIIIPDEDVEKFTTLGESLDYIKVRTANG